MRKWYYVLTITLVCFTPSIFAQSILAGNLEPVTSVSACMFSSNLTFSSQMGGNANAFSTIKQSTSAYGTFQFFNASCSDGNPESGNWFISMQWSNGMGSGGTPAGADAISLKVSPQMNSGHTYQLSFYTKKNTFYPPTQLAVGYSTLDTTFGNYIAVLPEPTSSTTWTLHTYTFTPSVNSAWITVKADSTTMVGNFNYIDIDNFSLADVTGVENVTSMQCVKVFPNPFHTTARITVDDNIAMPYQLTVYDLTGRIIMQQENISNKEIPIGRNDLANGAYIIRIKDKEAHIFTSRLLAK